jgi:hypothetical protein
VIELGKSVALQLRDMAGRNGGLRGMMCEFTKSTKAKHSRTDVAYEEARAPAWALAIPEIDLHEVLARTWERGMSG